MRFVYSVVRFVPDPGRGEFINVGAIVGSEESSEWGIRQVENPVRARAIDDRGTLEAAWAFINRVGRSIDAYEVALETPTLLEQEPTPLSEDWLRNLVDRHRHIVQLTDPVPMVAKDLSEALDRVCNQVLLEPARQRHPFKKKHAALAAVRLAYRRHGLEPERSVFERVLVETPHHRERLDFAVGNGRIVQLTQTWSFQIPEQETLAEQIKAWGWTIRDVRGAGGLIRTREDRALEVAKGVDVAVVYVPPEPNQPAPALRDAIAVAEELGATFLPLEGADQVAAAAEKLAS